MTERAKKQLAVVRRGAVVLSADVVGYCQLMARDDARTVQAIVNIRSGVSALVRLHNGRVVDAVGDNFLMEFSDESAAVRCGIRIQQALLQFNRTCPNDQQVRLRIGIHCGDVLDADGALYGSTVNIAARLQAMAEPGCICLSSEVADRLDEVLRRACVFCGPRTLRNIPEPVRTAHLAVRA